MLDAIFRVAPDRVVPVVYDASGHRVATQYLLAALHGDIPAAELLTYREPHGRLPGHPERGVTPGLAFSSGRLGHLWPLVNGVALAHPDRAVFCLSSDGSLQEGNDAEAARFSVARGLRLKLLVDDNNSTCSGHPADYLPGYDIARTLAGHGLHVDVGDGEDLDALYARICAALASPARSRWSTAGPCARAYRRWRAKSTATTPWPQSTPSPICVPEGSKPPRPSSRPPRGIMSPAPPRARPRRPATSLTRPWWRSWVVLLPRSGGRG